MTLSESTVTDARTGLPLYQPPDLTGTALSLRDHAVTHHGDAPEDPENVWPGRPVIDVPDHTWPAARPEQCGDLSGRGVWLDAPATPVTPVRARTRWSWCVPAADWIPRNADGSLPATVPIQPAQMINAPVHPAARCPVLALQIRQHHAQGAASCSTRGGDTSAS